MLNQGTHQASTAVAVGPAWATLPALSFLCSTTSCRSLSMPSQVKAVVEVSSVVLVAFRRSTSWNVLRRNTGYATVWYTDERKH
jgi:hypothetical protein